MEDVCKKTGVRDQQLDQEIPESDIILIADKFPHLLNVHKVGSTLNLVSTYPPDILARGANGALASFTRPQKGGLLLTVCACAK